ncbi:TM2 domain-containing protein [Aquimarina algicola]|uniref:TM2 domain-containing protein n=1 Tax=Aquimarina algicola TaxID=2589995 RepID=A0A504JBD1_9FLAO|nr:TM2 domain-containing protein [Aquimarina algicola]TPN83870.1 TM2 domain-containing protein [Aquimarina algicola]
MSEENNNTGDNIGNEAGETANDFSSGAQEVLNQENKKMIAGILGIILGGFGVHKFYLGYTKEGIIQLIVTIVTCGAGSIIGLIEGIIYLTKSDDEFYQTYQVGSKPWF